ncbi:site-specific integrase [Vicingaceae bacterium]|nr:site-specific integrase [Vicingaceae bacterium]
MNKLSLFPFIKADKSNSKGEAPVFLKIKIANTNSSMALGIKVNMQRWKETDQFRKSRVNNETKVRNDIDVIISVLRSINDKLEKRGMPISASTIKNVHINGSEDSIKDTIMLSELFDKHYKNFKPLVDGKSRAKETLRKYETLRNHVDAYLVFEYGVTDVSLDSLNYSFIESFDTFLRTEKNIGNNTTVKYVQSFRRLMNVAVKYDWLLKDPFILYEKKVKVKDATYLTQVELDAIMNLKFSTKRLEVVRDIFIFGCYTGYAPVDINKLTYNDVIDGEVNQKWIVTKRTKTGVNSDVPLLPKAEELIEQYKSDPYCIETNHLLPKRSNQRMNMYLKEIADLANINKKLTQYCSRHSFAITVVLANGLSMEVLSKMMGHTNLKQTMHYGKIQNARVGKEMLELRNKLSK